MKVFCKLNVRLYHTWLTNVCKPFRFKLFYLGYFLDSKTTGISDVIASHFPSSLSDIFLKLIFNLNCYQYDLHPVKRVNHLLRNWADIITMNHNYYTMANIAVSYTSPAIRSLGCQIVYTKDINNHVTTVPYITALFNNMQTLKFKGRATNAFFTAVNQIFGGSSQLSTTAEHCFVVWIVHRNLITTRSAVVGSCEEPLNIWLTVAKNTFVGWAFNFRVCMLLKGAVTAEVASAISLAFFVSLLITFCYHVVNKRWWWWWTEFIHEHWSVHET